MKKFFAILTVLVSLSVVNGAALDAITEGFNPGGGNSLAVNVTPAKHI